MGKSSIGPDLTDVEILMRAVEGLHGGQVQVSVSPVGIGATGGLSVVSSFTLPNVEGLPSVRPLLVVTRWPCPHHREFYSCLFDAIYRLDAEIARSYVQQKLPEG